MRSGRPEPSSLRPLHSPVVSKFGSLLAFLLITPALAAAHTSPSAHVHAGMRWEQALTSAATYSNPYRHLLLKVEWECSSGCNAADATTLTRFGFWDGGAGGRTFKFRTLFPQPRNGATWRWRTTCTTTAQGTAAGEPDCSTDGGLVSASSANVVTVVRSDGANGVTNPLYQAAGFLAMAGGSISGSGGAKTCI